MRQLSHVVGLVKFRGIDFVHALRIDFALLYDVRLLEVEKSTVTLHCRSHTVPVCVPHHFLQPPNL